MRRLIEALKAPVRRHWPRLRLRTILLLTFVVCAALPGVGALFLRVYENALVRQTEAELIAQGAALAATVGAEWPGSRGPAPPPTAPRYDPYGVAGGELSTVDLRATPVLSERPAAVAMAGAADPAAVAAARRVEPVLRTTTATTLASILLLDARGRILVGPQAGRGYPDLAEVMTARSGRAATELRRNAAYRPRYALEWLSRASDLRIHHARPIFVNGRVVGVLLLSRSPRALFRGLYEDRGKIIFGASAIFLTLVVLSGLLSRGIARPIEALSAATRDIALGGGAVPDPPPTAAIEIQALYADFATMAEAIERRSRYLRDFAHAVSHEFKTPLAGISGAIELLDEHHGAMSESERRRFLANIGADAARLTHLVTRLLDLARADMAEVDRDATSDLGLVLRRVADAYAAPGLAIDLRVPGALPAVAMPMAMLETIIASLVENSRQAGASRITLAAVAARPAIRLTVSDDGPGIPAADRERVFEPFFTSRRATGGTGLGLPIARSLLASHQGSIALADSPGTMFALLLPRAGD